jgi:hypothetical protein
MLLLLLPLIRRRLARRLCLGQVSDESKYIYFFVLF